MARTGPSRANFQVSSLAVDGINFQLATLFVTVNFPDEGHYLRFEGDTEGNIRVFHVTPTIEGQFQLTWCYLEDLVKRRLVHRTRILENLLANDVISQDDIRYLREDIDRAFNRLIRGMNDTKLPLAQPFYKAK